MVDALPNRYYYRAVRKRYIDFHEKTEFSPCGLHWLAAKSLAAELWISSPSRNFSTCIDLLAEKNSAWQPGNRLAPSP